MYALIGLSLFVIPALLGVGAWFLSRQDIKSLRTQRQEILARMNRDESASETADQANPAEAYFDALVEDVEANAFRKSGRRINEPTSSFGIAMMVGDELHFLDESGKEAAGDDDGRFLYLGQIQKSHASDDKYLLDIGQAIKPGTVIHHGVASYQFGLLKHGKAFFEAGNSGRIFTHGGIKAKGRKKAVFVTTKDEKSVG